MGVAIALGFYAPDGYPNVLADINLMIVDADASCEK